jgi:hypothetical protein
MGGADVMPYILLSAAHVAENLLRINITRRAWIENVWEQIAEEDVGVDGK